MINEIVDSLQNTNKFNIPGIAEAYFISLDDIAYMPSAKDRLKSFNAEMSVSDFVMNSGGAIMPLSNDSHVSTEFKEDDKANAQSPFFVYQLELTFGNDDEATRGQYIRSFGNRQWILLVKESTGAWRVMGSSTRGCDFKATSSSGTQVKGQSLLKCVFYWESGYRAFYLTPPAFGSILVDATYDTGTSMLTIDLTLAGFSGVQTGVFQLYVNGQWQDIIGTYSLTDGTYSAMVPYMLASGTYYFRIVNSDGVPSNTFSFTV